MTHEIKIGDTVSFEGQEYVLYCVNRTNDLEGRAFTVHGMDAQRAMRHMEEQEQRRRALENSEKFTAMMPKIERVIDESTEA